MKRSLVLKWINEAIVQDFGTQLFIPTISREAGKSLKKAFTREIEIHSALNPEDNSTLLLTVVRKDKKWWLAVKKVKDHALTGFIKKADGTVKRVSIEDEEGRLRRLQLMKEDGFSLDEAEIAEGPLSREEIFEYLNEGD